MSADLYIRVARKAGECQYALGSGRRCFRPIAAGERYVVGEVDTTSRSPFARERYCLKHFEPSGSTEAQR